MSQSGTIVFSHGNSFPGGTYRSLFEVWERAGFRVLAPARFGHDPRYPVTRHWLHVRDELVDFVLTHCAGQRVHLVGHSLGGYLSLMAASRKPEIAAGVVMIDSPIVAGWRAHGLHAFKLTGLVRRVSPGRISRRRRDAWPDAPSAREHFSARRAFARWDRRVLDDYIACGLQDAPGGGVRLAFDREIETRLYDTLPHDIPRMLRVHPPHCPVGFVGGTQSVEVRQVGMAATEAVTHGRIAWIDGTHLIPMEAPQATAQAVLAMIDG